jgi:hypothetical protein
LIPVWLIFWLNFTPCADSWSVDRLQRIARGTEQVDVTRPAAIYGWCRYVGWALIAIPYTISGIQKLTIGGWYWWRPVNLQVHVYASQLTDRGDAYFFGYKPGLWIAQQLPDAAFGAMALLALCVETFYILVLFSRRARLVIPLLASAMHVGVFVLQKFLFTDCRRPEAKATWRTFVATALRMQGSAQRSRINPRSWAAIDRS